MGDKMDSGKRVSRLDLTSKYFYYDDTGNIFSNRFQTLASDKKIYFHFHDAFFKKQNWNIEPSETLDALYKQRAQQIRDRYDYLVLCYSGGIDSTQILETFYYNNIHIDEIVMVGAFSQDSFKGSDENHNGEIYRNCLGTLNNFNLPNTKITMLDYSKHFSDIRNFSLIRDYGSDFYQHLGVRTSVSRLFWNNLDEYVNSKDNTGYIFGRDKPHMFYDAVSDNYGVYFSDFSFMTGVREVYKNGETVNFYTDPECFLLMLKQYHTIINHHKNLKDRDTHTREQKLYHDYMKNIIYNLKTPLIYQSKKSKFTFLSNKDMFLIKNKSSDMFKIYADSLQKIKAQTEVMKPQSLIASRVYRI